MPIGIVSDTDFQSELDRLSGSIKSVSVPVSGTIEQLPTKGRNTGDNNVPESLRKIIGEDAAINGRQSALQIAKISISLPPVYRHTPTALRALRRTIHPTKKSLNTSISPEQELPKKPRAR